MEDIEDIGKGEDSLQVRQKTDYSVKIHLSKTTKLKKPNALSKSKDLPGVARIYVKTFGCSHNISDSQFMEGKLSLFLQGLLVAYGYDLVDSLEDADACLINSCTVKNPSQDVFLNLMEKAQQLKKVVVVAGCVPQGDRNIKGLDKVSIIGVTQIDRVVEVMEQSLKGNIVRLLKKKELPSLDLPKIRRNPRLEIIPLSTGCLGSCTYCKTKHARGKLGSYLPEAILQRVKSAVSEGVKEIWLTSQDTGAYGRDIGTSLPELCFQVVKLLPEDCMLRIGMTNPPYILEHLPAMAAILRHPRVFSFLHIPVQSGNDTVLNKMNREYTRAQFQEVCDYLLSALGKDVSLATDIICGFPTETSAQFQDTLELVDKYRFPVLNISQFYPRPGTVAAKMPRVPTKEVKARATAITKLFNSYTCYDHLVNTEQRVWILEKDDHPLNHDMVVGHTKGYVKVLVKGNQDLLGKMVIVRITEAQKWHVTGEIIDTNPQGIPLPQGDYFKKFQKKEFQTDETTTSESGSLDSEVEISGGLYYKQSPGSYKWLFWAGVGLVAAGIVSSLFDVNLFNL